MNSSHVRGDPIIIALVISYLKSEGFMFGTPATERAGEGMRGDDRIAIIGIGLRYPDVTSPTELWENMLSGRAGATARPVARAETGLALDVVTAALADAGCRDGDGLPRPATGVVLGSTDTTLAAGICRHFDLGGGGFTVAATSNAPASLPVRTAAAALADRTVDVAIAGQVGVDGAGLLVLMREADALAGDRRIYALITGTDDGPVPYVDGCPPGIAGLIAVVLAVHHQVLPPSAGSDPALWPAGRPIRAAVPVLDTHMVIEEAAGRQRLTALPKRTVALSAGRQDAELLLLDAPDVRALRDKVADLTTRVPRLAGPKLTDLAGILAAELARRPVRAAVVATDATDAQRKLARLLDALDAGQHTLFAADDGVFLDGDAGPARIAYLFPGPSGAVRGTVGVLRRRFALVDNVFRVAGSPCVVSASLAATRLLFALGIDADIAAGAGLGQATALAWGGALGGGDLLRLAKADSPLHELAATALAPLNRPIIATASDGDAAIDEALVAAVADADLAIEVGPWRTLTELVGRIAPDTPVLSVETDSASLVPLLRVVGAAHALGVDVDTTTLFAGRVIRPIAPERPVRGAEVPGVAPWVFTFAVDHLLFDEPPSPPHRDTAPGTWSVFASPGHPLAEPLAAALADAGLGDGVLLCLPASGADHLDLIRAAADAPGHRFVVVQHRFGATAVARACHRAEPGRPVTVVDLADPTPDDPVVLAHEVRRVVAEVAATIGFSEARYDVYGNRTVPCLSPLPKPAGVIMSSPLGATDVLLVTGGADGMVAAYARELARDSDAGLIVADTAGGIDVDLGGVTAIMHVATDDAGDLRSALDAVAIERLKLLVTFGPADDWAGELTIQFGQDHPRTRAVAVSCAVPLLTDEVRTVLRRILTDPSAGPRLVVSGRAAGLALAGPPVPARTRFVDRVLVHYPGVELVTETELHAEADPYLDDYRTTAGEPMFPLAMGVEAVAQVAAALTGRTGPAMLTDVEFGAPIVVPAGQSTTMRVAALVRDTETVDVVISGSTTDHIRATLHQPRPAPPAGRQEPRFPIPAVPIDPITELYGGILGQGKQFQRLLTFRRVTASRVVAEVATTAPAPWFEPSLPPDLVSADPGTRDAVLQTVQCCVPDATVVPVGVARMFLSAPIGQHIEYVVVDARERGSDGDIHRFDVDVLDPTGVVVERWEGLTVRAVRATGRPWVPALLGPQLERTLRRVLGGDRVVVVEPDPVPPEPYRGEGGIRRADLAASRAFGHPVRLRHGENGAPWVVGANVAVDHGAGMTLLVAGQGRLGCAIDTVPDAVSTDLAGDAYPGVRARLMAELGDTAAAAGARILAAVRATGEESPALDLDRGHPDGWVSLRTGDTMVATWVTTTNNRPDSVVFAVLTGEERCHD